MLSVTWTLLRDHRNIRRSKKPKCPTKYGLHHTWEHTWPLGNGSQLKAMYSVTTMKWREGRRIRKNIQEVTLTHWLLEVFAKNAFSGHFGDFQPGKKHQERSEGRKEGRIYKRWHSNPLTPGGFHQKRIFLDILEIFSPEMSQISSDLLKKEFATWLHAILSTGTTFYNIFARACLEIKISRLERKSDIHL